MTSTTGFRANWRIYLSLLGLPLLVVATATAVAVLAVQLLRTSFTYEATQARLSVLRTQAVHDLKAFAVSRQDVDWVAAQSALKRLALERETRGWLLSQQPGKQSLARQTLQEAGWPHDEVDILLWPYAWLGSDWVPDLAQAHWDRIDKQVEALTTESARLQALPSDQIAAALLRLEQIDQRMNESSHALDRLWSQWSNRIANTLVAGIALMAGWLAWVSLRQIRRSLRKQRQHDQTLGTVQQHWELASSAARLGLYKLDKDRGTIEFDALASSMHGLADSPLTVTREQVRAMILPDDVEATRQATDQAGERNRNYQIQYRVRHPDGQIRTLEATGRVVHGQQGHGDALVGVLRDVTDALRQAEQAMKREAAEHVAQAQREFLSRLSHELRTPLNAILGFAQLLDMDVDQGLSQAQHQQIEWILSAGKQLLALIEDVMDLSKVESGEIPMHLASADVIGIIKACIPMVDAARRQHQVILLDRTDAAHPLLATIDSQRLRQVLVNLLSNACKYNRPGGHVTIDARTDGGEVVIDIADNGIGMSAEDARTLFQPFKRIASAAGHAEGTGLGLYIVKQLVERMQGSVALESSPGVGSKFTVRLRAA